MFSPFNNTGQFLPSPGAQAELWGLIAQYQELAATDSHPVKRGRAFNGFLASLLRAGGLEAYADQRGLDGRDEIDVAFSFEHRQFILEAKWLTEKVNDDALEKLRGRLKVRLSGTLGVFVSMSGYTEPALEKAKWFTDVLLLDRSHVEALATGLLTAPELLGRALSWVSRRGGSHAPLGELITTVPVDAAAWLRPAEPAPEVVHQAPGVNAAAVLAGPPGTALTGATSQANNLLLTTNEGLLRLDPATGETQWLLGMPGSREAAVQAGARTTVLCGAAAVTLDGTTAPAPLAGPFPNRARLLESPDGGIWVFATTGPPGYGGRHTVIRLGERPADQQAHEIDFVGKVDNVVLVVDDRLYLVGGSRAGVLGIQREMSLPEEAWKHAPPLSECSALLPWGDHTVLSAGRASDGTAVEVYRTDLRTHEHTLLLTVLGQRVISLAAAAEGTVSLIMDAWLPDSALPRPVLFSIVLPESVA